MNHISLFSGIGGFDLASEWMGWENVAHCEINPFCRQVLNYYWPNAISYEDITKTDFTIHRGTIDVLTGGFPCQPYSLAGQRKGKDDERHLWPEMLRAIREIQPAWVVGENVFGLVNWNGGMVFEEVQADLEAEGYEVQPYVLPAAAVNAPHRRDRVWFVAYSANARAEILRQKRENTVLSNGIAPHSNGCSKGSSGACSETKSHRCKNNDEPESRGKQAKQHTGCSHVLRSAADTEYKGLQGSKKHRSIRSIREERNKQFAGLLSPDWEKFPTQSPVCGGNDGIPDRLDFEAVFEGIEKPRNPARKYGRWRQESLKAYGNAIVPQVVYQIFKSIEQYENREQHT